MIINVAIVSLFILGIYKIKSRDGPVPVLGFSVPSVLKELSQTL